MATFAPSSTPSPPPTIRTPPTPKHGFSDPWEPYAPRKSARISAQRASNRTPSPQSSRRSGTPPPTTRKPAASTSTIMSPMPSPQKKRLPALDSAHSASGPAEGAADAAASLGRAKTKLQQQQEEEARAASSITRRAGMLPTPVKTPKKAPTEAQNAGIQAVARNLFSHEESASAPSSPRKKRNPKKYSGITMESFNAQEVEEPIQIFTDSRDRVPQVDASADNPFYGNSASVQPEPPRRRSKRNVTVPGEGAQSVDDAMQRDDGMIYVFRGKKIFRKFVLDDANDEEGADPDDRLGVPLTRSSIKPRRLFQNQSEPQVTPEDEEALTDIEDDHMEHAGHAKEDHPQTPVADNKSCPDPPAAPKFGPEHTPPETRRTTRFGAKSEEATPSKPKHSLGEWPREESRSTSAEGALKRSGDDAALATSAPKRARA